jgi:dipeptidyl-peptidase 4
MKHLNIFFGFIVLFIVSQAAIAQKKDFTLDDFTRRGMFYGKSVYGLRSMNDGLSYSKFENRNAQIAKYSYQTGEQVQVLFDLAKSGIKADYIEAYDFSNDETKILLQTNSESIYRRSFTADYYVYDIKTAQTTALSANGAQQLATFSPDGSKVAFVRKNNLFIKDLTNNNETQITSDGEFNKIINGAPDWVYEEEFEFSRAFDWSADGKNLAFIRFDESRVKMFSMTMFEGQAPQLKENSVYPSDYSFKYPKAGEDNSIVTVLNYNLANKEIKKMDIGTETNIYIPRIKWTNDPNKLCIMRLNRLQNKLEFLAADPATGSTSVFYTEENKRYIDETLFDDLQFTADNKNFIFTSERDGYKHIYFYDMTGKIVRQVTSGQYDVTDFYGYDPISKVFYYAAADESPVRRTVNSISLDGKKKMKYSTLPGTNRAEFSKTFKYYINFFSSASTPTLVTLHDGKGKLLRTLEANEDLKKKLEGYNVSAKEFIEFTTTENIKLNGWMMKPVNFDASKKYPVFMTQYSGPNSQSALDKWSIGWEQVLTSKGYIVVCVDGRGTGARGEEFRKCTYLQLGKYECLDQIETAKYLGTLPYVDAKRIGIWGWSFGGFMASLCMTKGADYFKAGIAVAPVTNWRYYDNIYTERFMRTPQENANGYDDNSPINYAKLMKGKFLLCHGLADDNVHFQNAAEFSERLVQAGVQFEMQIYTNRNHGISGGNTSSHLYTRMLNFIFENL